MIDGLLLDDSMRLIRAPVGSAAAVSLSNVFARVVNSSG